MPKIRRRNVPEAVLQHLLDRVEQRRITYDQIHELAHWLASDPTVPSGKWFKRFDGFTICGDDELVKTFLLPGQLPDGQEIP